MIRANSLPNLFTAGALSLAATPLLAANLSNLTQESVPSNIIDDDSALDEYTKLLNEANEAINQIISKNANSPEEKLTSLLAEYQERQNWSSKLFRTATGDEQKTLVFEFAQVERMLTEILEVSDSCLDGDSAAAGYIHYLSKINGSPKIIDQEQIEQVLQTLLTKHFDSEKIIALPHLACIHLPFNEAQEYIRALLDKEIQPEVHTEALYRLSRLYIEEGRTFDSPLIDTAREVLNELELEHGSSIYKAYRMPWSQVVGNVRNHLDHWMVGAPIEELQGFDLNGEQLALSQLLEEGKVVVISFWASWCGPCMLIVPEEEKVLSEFEEQVAYFGINVDYKEELAKAAATNHPMLSQSLWAGKKGPWGEIPISADIHSFPAVFVVAPDGIIRAAHTGLSEGKVDGIPNLPLMIENTGNQLRASIRVALDSSN